MSWNYRIIYEREEYSMHEVYYDQNGDIEGWTKYPVPIIADTPEELKSVLEMMENATTKPVLIISPTDSNKLLEKK